MTNGQASQLIKHLSAALLTLIWLAPATLGPVFAQSPQRIAGTARVVDGDTIDVGSTRIRLWGIDAPEGRQQCEGSGAQYLCGAEATRQLVALIRMQDVDCMFKTVDRYKRVVAICSIGRTDLGAEMVRAGWALAFVRYSSDYVAQENEARLAKRGLWAGAFQPPWEYRQR